MNPHKLTRPILILALMIAGTGCTVHPPGEAEERRAATQAGKPFETQIESRQLPELQANPTADQLVEFALLNNAQLERDYWQWRSAIEQIPQDGTQSSSPNVAAGTTFTNGRTSLRSSTVTLANDPMTDIKWPGKLDAAARQSLANARAAGQRFIKAKYELRFSVLSAYYDYALNAKLIDLARSDQQLLHTTAAVTEARNGAGNVGEQDVLKATNEVDMSGNDIANMLSQLPGEVAAINAFLGRPAEAPLPLPADLPPARSLAYDDAELIDLAAKRNPELLALADEIHASHEAVRLARLQYVPDFNFSAGSDLMGITQSILGQFTVPVFRYEAINAAITQAQANSRAADAMRRQSTNDLGTEAVTDVNYIRDADRQIDLFQHTILPRVRELVSLGRSGYETGHGSLLDLLDDQRSLIAIERLVAGLRIDREKRFAELESITTMNLSEREREGAPEPR
jgi:outer membrane protein TolC